MGATKDNRKTLKLLFIALLYSVAYLHLIVMSRNWLKSHYLILLKQCQYLKKDTLNYIH